MATAGLISVIVPARAAWQGDDVVRRAVLPIPALVVLQVGLEGSLGRLTDRSHPITGMVFSIYRIRQIRRAECICRTTGDTQVRRTLPPQQGFWVANLAMLAATVAGRTWMKPTKLGERIE